MTGEPADRPRVVIAEDEALIRLDLAEMLAEEGYDVVGQAADGVEAVELATALRPDLVVMDVKMPRLDGIAAASRIAGERIAPVVMLTAFSQRDLVDRPGGGGRGPHRPARHPQGRRARQGAAPGCPGTQ